MSEEKRAVSVDPDDGWSTRDLPRPHAFIQWKGTKVCMDFYCTCGDQIHIDDDFAYAVRCHHCGRVFQMSSMIEAREIDPKDWHGCEPREDDESGVEEVLSEAGKLPR